MADIVDFDQARHRKVHAVKEAKIRRIRNAFKAVRESWQQEGKPLKGIFNKHGKGRKK